MDIIVRRVDFARGREREKERGQRMDRRNRIIRQNAMSRYLEFIAEGGVLKNRRWLPSRRSAGGEKAANKSRPRKRITRESRAARREIW